MANKRSDSPEQRKRRLAPAKTTYTVSMAGVEVQKRFLIKKSTIFLLVISMALLGCWTSQWLLLKTGPVLRFPLAITTLLFFVFGLWYRHRRPRWHAPMIFLGLILTGVSIGFFVSPLDRRVQWNFAAFILTPLIGIVLNSLLMKKDRSTFVQYLWTGPWLMLAAIGLWFLVPTHEWSFALAGFVAVLLVFFYYRASKEILELYNPNEAFSAAADIFSINLILFWRKLTNKI